MLIEAAVIAAHGVDGKADEMGEFLFEEASFRSVEARGLEHEGSVVFVNEAAGFLNDVLERFFGPETAVMPGSGGKRRDEKAIGQRVIPFGKGNGKVEGAAVQDDPFHGDPILEKVGGKAAAAERSVTCASEVDGGVPPLRVIDVGVDEFAKRLDVSFHAEEEVGVRFYGYATETALNGVDENEVGVFEDRLGIVDDFVGGKRGSSFAGRKEAARAKGEDRFERSGCARATREDKGDGAIRLLIFRIGDEKEFGLFISFRSKDGAHAGDRCVGERTARELDVMMRDGERKRGEVFLFFICKERESQK